MKIQFALIRIKNHPKSSVILTGLLGLVCLPFLVACIPAMAVGFATIRYAKYSQKYGLV
jgi:hypothetical protein